MIMRPSRFCTWLAGLVAAHAVFLPCAFGEVTGVAGLDVIARLTGPGSINQTGLVNVGGTDLGHMVVHQNKVFFLFGDTFSGDTPAIGGNWRRNAMAWSTGPTFADGVLFDGWITDPSSKARQVIGDHTPTTTIPTGAISVGNRIYAWFMQVATWGDPGVWTLNYAGLAYTEDLGQTFPIVSSFWLPPDTNFGMVAASTRTDLPPGTDDYVYIWGTTSGRFGGVKLARVPPDQVADLASYRYFSGLSNGQPIWAGLESSGALIVPAPVGEMSVMYNRAAKTWNMLYFNQSALGGWGAIQLRQARAPWGPWSAAINVVNGSAYPTLYGSYMNPVFVENHGQNVYFTMSLYSTYDVYLMRARYDLSSIPSPADLDVDGKVANSDAQMFIGCMSEADVPCQDILACSAADLDRDGDVDQSDYGLLQRCYSEALAPADPNCTN